MTDEIDSSLYALGALRGEDYAAARRKARNDADFCVKVADWEAALAPMAAFSRPARAPDDLLARIESRLDAGASDQTQGKTVRAGEGRWIQLAPGLRMKPLRKNAHTGRQTILLDVRPGAIYEGHAHDQDEEIFMISGDLRFDGIVLGPGDYHLAPMGSRHPRAASERGCLCLIVCAL